MQTNNIHFAMVGNNICRVLLIASFCTEDHYCTGDKQFPSIYSTSILKLLIYLLQAMAAVLFFTQVLPSMQLFSLWRYEQVNTHSRCSPKALHLAHTKCRVITFRVG